MNPCRLSHMQTGREQTMQNVDKVIQYFKEFSAIPHASCDEKRVSDYLVSFAKERGLEAQQDEHWNVLIKKPATVPNCKSAPLIIQGHMDMVYVQSIDCKNSYEDGISVVEKGGWLYAEGTSLGADNGIAVAYAMALLDSNNIPHPDLEVLLTVQEEVGLYGAEKFDCSRLRGKYLINLDTENEGVFYTSCAGAFRSDMEIPLSFFSVQGMTALKVSLSGMFGGHSGIDIHRGRGNAIVLMARLLTALNWDGVYLSSLSCDGKMNAIANRCDALLYIAQDRIDNVLDSLNRSVAEFNSELKNVDLVELQTVLAEEQEVLCYTRDSRVRALSAMLLMPNGVLGMSADIGGLVETSANPGIITQKEKSLIISSCVRSCVATRKAAVAKQLEALARLCGGKCVFSNDYPQWEYREKSPLRDLAMDCYRDLFCLMPKTAAIHAGLECGYFDAKIKDVDIISFGPDQRDVHTPNESANIKSIQNVWKLLQLILERLAAGEGEARR